MFPELGDDELQFHDFHHFSLNCVKPVASVLITKHQECRFSKKFFVVEPSSHKAVVYYEQRGTHLSARVTKYMKIMDIGLKMGRNSLIKNFKTMYKRLFVEVEHDVVNYQNRGLTCLPMPMRF